MKEQTHPLKQFKKYPASTENSFNLVKDVLLSKEQIIKSSVKYKPRCGIYFLIYQDTIQYVGQSRNLDMRLATHFNGIYSNLSDMHFIECDEEDLDALETAYILSIRPTKNYKTNYGYYRVPCQKTYGEFFQGNWHFIPKKDKKVPQLNNLTLEERMKMTREERLEIALKFLLYAVEKDGPRVIDGINKEQYIECAMVALYD